MARSTTSHNPVRLTFGRVTVDAESSYGTPAGSAVTALVDGPTILSAKKAAIPSEAVRTQDVALAHEVGVSRGSTSLSGVLYGLPPDGTGAATDSDLPGLALAIAKGMGVYYTGGRGTIKTTSTTTLVMLDADAATFEIGQAVLIQTGASGETWEVSWLVSGSSDTTDTTFTLATTLAAATYATGIAYGGMTAVVPSSVASHLPTSVAVEHQAYDADIRTRLLGCVPSSITVDMQPGALPQVSITEEYATMLRTQGSAPSDTLPSTYATLCTEGELSFVVDGVTTTVPVRSATWGYEPSIQEMRDPTATTTEGIVGMYPAGRGTYYLDLELYVDPGSTIESQGTNALWSSQTAAFVSLSWVDTSTGGIHAFAIPAALVQGDEPTPEDVDGYGILRVRLVPTAYTGDTGMGGTYSDTLVDSLFRIALLGGDGAS